MKIQKGKQVYWHNKAVDSDTIVRADNKTIAINWDYAGQWTYPIDVVNKLIIDN
jgi:hypothetical protein